MVLSPLKKKKHVIWSYQTKYHVAYICKDFKRIHYRISNWSDDPYYGAAFSAEKKNKKDMLQSKIDLNRDLRTESQMEPH